MIDVVCAVIRDQDGKVLICKRPEGKALPGYWEFPGGKVELEEDFTVAIQREIREELACEIEVGMALPRVDHHYPEYSIRLWPFICDVCRGMPQAVEHSELRWVDLSQCDALKWAPADVPIYEALGSLVD